MTVKTKEIIEGRKQSVLFLLFDKSSGKVLIEKRSSRVRGDKMVGMLVVPAGKIEDADKTQGEDYFQNALKREVLEEFGVTVTGQVMLFEVTHTTPNGHTYDSKVYLVCGWQGNVSNKEGKHEHLWLDFSEAENVVSLPIARRTIQTAREHLNRLYTPGF